MVAKAKEKEEVVVQGLCSFEDPKRAEGQDLAWVSPQALAILLAPTPKDVIREREGPGRKMLSYVKHGWYRARLNEAFGFDWDWEIVKTTLDTVSNFVVVEGMLTARVRDRNGTIKTTIKKSGIGGADLKRFSANISGGYVDVGNDTKAADTEAFKRACLGLGLGLDLYWDDDAPVAPDQKKAPTTTWVKDVCANCGKPLEAGISRSTGKAYTAVELKELTIKAYKKPLCIEH